MSAKTHKGPLFHLLQDQDALGPCSGGFYGEGKTLMGYPRNSSSSIQPFLHLFGCAIQRMLVDMAHDTAPQNGPHKCTYLCLNYPLQTWSNVCGVESVILAVIVAQDEMLFKVITGPCQLQRIFLHNPKLYDIFAESVNDVVCVRHCWLDMKYILPKLNNLVKTEGQPLLVLHQRWRNLHGDQPPYPLHQQHTRALPVQHRAADPKNRNIGRVFHKKR